MLQITAILMSILLSVTVNNNALVCFATTNHCYSCLHTRAQCVWYDANCHVAGSAVPGVQSSGLQLGGPALVPDMMYRILDIFNPSNARLLAATAAGAPPAP